MKTPGTGSSPSLERGLDHLRDEPGADDEAGTRRRGRPHLLGVDDGADADRPSFLRGARDRRERAGSVDRHLDLLDPAADERRHRARDVAAVVEAHDSEQRAGSSTVGSRIAPTLSQAML